MHNKKGILAMMTVVALALMITVLLFTQTKPLEQTLSIGEKQTFLLQSYGYGEFTKDYLVDSAEFALDGALYNLGQNGLLAEPYCDPNTVPLIIKCTSSTGSDFFSCSNPTSKEQGYYCGFASTCNTLSRSSSCSIEIPDAARNEVSYSCIAERPVPSCAEHTCGATAAGYLIWKNVGTGGTEDCTPTVNEAKNNIVILFGSYFRTYLAAYPSIPFSTRLDGTLNDYLRYEYDLSMSPLSVKTNPAVRKYSDFTILNNEGELEEVDIIVKSEVMIGDPDIGFTYRVDPFASAGTHIDLNSIISTLRSDVTRLGSLTCINDAGDKGTCIDLLTSTQFEYTTDYTAGAVQISAKYLDQYGSPYKIPIHSGTGIVNEDLVFNFALKKN